MTASAIGCDLLIVAWWLSLVSNSFSGVAGEKHHISTRPVMADLRGFVLWIW